MKNEIKLFIALLAIFCILASLQSCSQSKIVKAMKKESIVDKSVIFRATNLVTGTIESIRLADSIENVYIKHDSVYTLAGRIVKLDVEWTKVVDNYPDLRLCNQLGGYIKYRIEED